MVKPRLLDLFCGAGGAGYGYMLAGFHVTGVDSMPQPRYRGDAFVQEDALTYLAAHGHEYNCVHASPPCQAYSALKHLARKQHPMLIEEVRAALRATGKPYVIENVVGAPLDTTLLLCGSMFGLETPCGAQLRRHRLFESNILLMSPGACAHGARPCAMNGHEFRNEATRWQERRETITVAGDHAHNPRLYRAAQRRMTPALTISIHGSKAANPRQEGALQRQHTISIHGDKARDRRTITVTGSTPQQNVEHNRIRETFSIADARIAMGIDWMGMKDLSQAIPPAYTHWIGTQLLRALH